ncbi:hypothetical protein F4808DRAFT_469762 [Astrocystis sublimbata]|nr:hypothetical protein F4808DRAFT_469762 [Astrocystis sublimbata]
MPLARSPRFWLPTKRDGAEAGQGRAATTSAPTTQARDQTNVGTSTERVLKVACNYEGYVDPSFDPRIKVRTGIANTLDITVYDVSTKVQKELYEIEIDRLLSALAKDAPSTFRGSAHLQADTQAAYETMTSLSNQIWTAFHIITHDTELLNLRYLTKLDGDESEGEDNENGEGGNDDKAELSALNYEGNREDYFELVNYTTEIVSRILLNCAHGGEWSEGILACMAKLSVKMKVLSANLEEFAATSLAQTPATLKQPVPSNLQSQSVEGQYTGRGGGMENIGAMLQSLSAEGSGIALAGANQESKRHALVQLYWLYTLRIQTPIQWILRSMLLSLRGVRRTKATSTTSYELCAMVYHTGFEDFPTLVYQDLGGEYHGSSRQVNINISQSAFKVLNSAIKNVLSPRNRSASIHGQRFNSGVGTTVSWSYSEANATGANSSNELETPPVIHIPDVQPTKGQLESMNEILTVIVPLITLNPYIIEIMTDFVGLMVRTTQPVAENDTDHVRTRTGTQFKAFFCLTTHEYSYARARSGHLASSQLSKSLMTRDKLVAGKAGDDIPKGTMSQSTVKRKGVLHEGILPFVCDFPFSTQQMDKQEQLARWGQELMDAKEKMKDWVFEEGGVRVFCGLYVWAVLTIAAMLVGGGIASGLTIQTRIQGVDPFNIATFTWVVAGFIILIAKSTRVESWSWRDFLHRQVLCRSVSELHYVTGIDYELILAKLLHDESTNRLKTRGPYNCVFTNRTDGADGFSIDKPLSIRTMLLSGLIMIHVQAPYYGEFLVCLDVRKGTERHYIGHNTDSTDEDASYIVSEIVPDFGLNRPERQRISLNREARPWSRVIGIYGRRDCEFI